MITPVGIGEARFSAKAGDVLVCYGLGSCVGVAFYDPQRRAGGLVHVMLPAQMGLAPVAPPTAGRATTGRPTVPPPAAPRSGTPAEPAQLGKFADLAIPHALKELTALGVAPARLQIRLVGGAQMLGLGGDRRFDIGSRNCEAVRAALTAARLTVAAEVTGGSIGRTMQFHIEDGRILVSSFGNGETII